MVDREPKWLTVDEAAAYGGWSSAQGVLAAIRRGTLQAENIYPDADPHRREYRLKEEWVDEYLVLFKRKGGGDVLWADKMAVR